MSSCLTGGGRAYGLNLDLIKPPTTFSTSNSSSSPSSTLSESSNSPLSIFTRKPRTPRKRPNQTYNEAAAILSTAYPKLFPPKNLSKLIKFTKSHHNNNRGPFLSEPPDLLIPFDRAVGSSGCFPVGTKVEKPCLSPGEVSSQGNFSEICDGHEQDFDAESILDEEVEEGIDSIMGNVRMDGETSTVQINESFCYGFPVGMGFDYGCGMRKELRAMRHVDEGDWWRFPCVNVADITRKIARIPVDNNKKKKKQKKKENLAAASASASSEEDSVPHPTAGLLLKLNYDDVLKSWSDKGSPFSGDSPVAESAGNDVQLLLAVECLPRGVHWFLLC
ncbi:hypothetical protein C2S53_002506 [Perilla frutescens var. hirtella]|uniref:Protein CHLOROPLAST IMPORT APPARATUS 2 n=1 Tax=Perilla frutescens var. hirtella TaxID=608512 RepID=A0AAD4IP08_PERFH|nr:hypothetical protein C2S53_002506 [Perilla frutescens var. hirtella]